MAASLSVQRPLTMSHALFPQQTLLRHAALVIVASLFTALSAQVSITLPFSPVPITGQTLAWLLVPAMLGPRLGAAAAVLYLVEGAVGLPFFAGGKSGWQALSLMEVAGSTSGYLIGSIFAAGVVGRLAERGWDRRPLTMAGAMLIGNVVLYVPGLLMLWMWAAGHTALLKMDAVPFTWAIEKGLLPFIAGDVVKLLLAAGLLPSGWGLLRRLGFRD